MTRPEAVAVAECWTINAVMPGPGDGEIAAGVLNMDRLGIPIAGDSSGQSLRGVFAIRVRRAAPAEKTRYDASAAG